MEFFVNFGGNFASFGGNFASFGGNFVSFSFLDFHVFFRLQTLLRLVNFFF